LLSLITILLTILFGFSQPHIEFTTGSRNTICPAAGTPIN
jgi:hypothetical protein